jgi:hypothetical protein
LSKFSMPKLRVDNIGSSQDVGGDVDAKWLVISIKDTLKREGGNPDKMREVFVGNFQQLSKCEQGTNAFKKQLNRLPDVIDEIAGALSSSDPFAAKNVLDRLDRFAQLSGLIGHDRARLAQGFLVERCQNHQGQDMCDLYVGLIDLLILPILGAIDPTVAPLIAPIVPGTLPVNR